MDCLVSSGTCRETSVLGAELLRRWVVGERVRGPTGGYIVSKFMGHYKGLGFALCEMDSFNKVLKKMTYYDFSF